MKESLKRTAMLMGEPAIDKLAAARVIIFGVGGVGGYVAEALARSGVGHMTLVDNDVVSESNLNRQIVALRSTIGMPKVECMKRRIADIDPDIVVDAVQAFYLPENASEFDLASYDYIIDCIDTVAAKIDLAVRAQALNVPIISAMGAGNKLDPTAFRVGDIYKTSVCPLARVMRTQLKKRGVKALKVVWSDEPPRTPLFGDTAAPGKRATPGSNAFCPSAAGLVLASAVIRDLAEV
ncbi:MAG: tRNA threonylcarbamoyladenosine dehydratase [Clostridia bacterium]|nr:tRNA threonylcarbamoyladenosine dehydratase [Clostridia bacterium]